MSFDKSQAVEAAKQYELQRNVQAAVDIYRKILQDDPSDLTVRNTLGELYASNGQVRDAIAEFTKAADDYIEHGLARKAIATLKKIIAIDPANTETATKLAELYGQAGLRSEARQHYLQIADALTHKGATLDALNIFSRVVELDPSNTSTRIKLGELYLREGMNEQAFEAFVTAASQLNDKGENRRALNAYNEALAIKPDSPDALAATRKLTTLLGVSGTGKVRNTVNERTGDSAGANPPHQLFHSSAQPITEDLGASSDGFVVQEISKAEILVAYGKVNHAVSMLRQVLEDRPDNIDVHIKLKDIYLRTGMMTEAAGECIALERIHKARGESERARDYAVRASRLTQLLEQPSGDLPRPRQKPVEPAPRSSSPPPAFIPQPDVVPEPVPAASIVDPRPVEPARMTLTIAPPNKPSVEVAPLDVSAEPQISHVKLVESAVPVSETILSVSPAQQSALVPVNRASTTTRERGLTSLVSLSLPAETKRGRRNATAIAAGVFVLLGTTAVIGGFAYNTHLDKQFAALSLAAPPITEPSPPAVEDQTEPVQQNEPITVVVTPTTQIDAAANRQNQETGARVTEQPAPPKPSSEPPRVITPPAPIPPRAIASPDARGGTETRTPLGVPGDVPIGTAHPAEPPPKLVRQSPGVVMGTAIKRVDPVYPSTARITQQAGAVTVEVTISEQGNVTSARALSGPALLRTAAVNAARGWKFKASTLGGVPVSTTTTIVFNFKL